MDKLLELLLEVSLEKNKSNPTKKALTAFVMEYKTKGSVKKAYKEVVNEKNIKKYLTSKEYLERTGCLCAILEEISDFLAYKELENDIDGIKFLLDKIKEYIKIYEDNLKED